jgi:hypothetical protein
MIRVKKIITHGLGALAILGILILSNMASACHSPTDSFATEVLLNKPEISYNLSGIIKSDDVIVKTKEVSILETKHSEGVPTPQAIIIIENNSTVVTETVVAEKPVETRTELDMIIYRSHYNPDVAVILSEGQIPVKVKGEWNENRYLSVKIQVPTKDVHRSMPYIRIGLTEDVNAAALDIDASADLGWGAEVSGSGSWTTEDGKCHTMKMYSLRKGDIQIDVMPAERTS